MSKEILEISIHRANWTNEELFLGEKINVTTAVIKQNGIYIDPSDDDFLEVIFKEYVRKNMDKNEHIELKLSATDLFFYGENSNAYLLNYIYNTLFSEEPQNPFNPLLETDEGNINIGLFNISENQINYLIKILYILEIDFKALSKKYMCFTFPQSLRRYDEDKVSNLNYKILDVLSSKVSVSNQ